MPGSLHYKPYLLKDLDAQDWVGSIPNPKWLGKAYFSFMPLLFSNLFLFLLFLMRFSIRLSKIQFKHPSLWESFLDLVLSVSFNQLRNYHAGGRGKGSRPRWCIESHPFCSSTDYNVEKNTHGLKMQFPAVVNAMNAEYWDSEKHIGH